MARQRTASTALSAAAGALAAAGAARQARASLAIPPARADLPPMADAKPVLSASDRENPDKLTGDDLRALAHRRGIARSEAAGMDDAKLRMQLRYLTNRQYTDEEA